MNRSIFSIEWLFALLLLAGQGAIAQDAAPSGSPSPGNGSPSGGARTGGSGTLSGRITEKDGGSLAGASVYIPDLKLGVVTDSSGRYQFKSLPSGKYLVEVHYIGYKTLTKTATVSGPVTLDFTLSDEFVEESPVVITGLSKAKQIKRS